MRNKYMLIGVAIVVGVVLLASVVVALAGNIDSPAGPTAAGGQMYTLEQIYDRIDDGTAATKQTTFQEPANGPGSTMHTLDEIYDLVGERAPVPKTGQTTKYADGDDGDLEKGVAWPDPRFTDNSNGTVTDNLTGLIWLKNANCAVVTRTWQIALDDVVQLNTNGEMNTHDCGDTSNGGSHQTDWRLPTVRELQSLIHYGCASPALPDTAGTSCGSGPFTGVQSDHSDCYWSSTTIANRTFSAWFVGLEDGNVNRYGCLKTELLYVWPVRGGQ